jgi:zinc-binding alcohol dehydrogenase family protein
MRAVGYRKSLPIDQAQALLDIEIDKPTPNGRDLLVQVKAISVNPVDTKVRMRAAPKDGEPPKILGYDAAGIVAAAGPDVTLFKTGDEVWYAGSIVRPGTNAEFHLVDERIVGRKPASIGFAEAAALPLTSITAWEMLFDRFGIARGGGADRTLLIVGGAGGVGSIAIQIARALTKLTVIATASRPETQQWCKALGAHHVIDHAKPMPEQVKAIGHRFVDYIFGVTESARHFDAVAEMIAPQGKFGLIDDPTPPLDTAKLKGKSASVHWEAMFTRSTFQTPDMIAQHELLTEVAAMVDAGTIRTTVADNFGPINAANLRRAHAQIESGTTRGKIVLEGF